MASSDARKAMIAVKGLVDRGQIGTAAWDEAFKWQNTAFRHWHSLLGDMGTLSEAARKRCTAADLTEEAQACGRPCSVAPEVDGSPLEETSK